MRKLVFLTGLLAVLGGNVQAKDWQVDAAHSKLSFTGEQSGEKFEGGFKKFTTQISLDPDHPETGKITVIIDTSSAYAGASDRDEMLPQKDWFDTSKFPQAQFTSTSIRKISDGHYEVAATLSIKSIVQNVTLPFTLVSEGDHWRAQGRVILQRDVFGIGQGMFANENYVKHAVDVTFDLVAKPLS